MNEHGEAFPLRPDVLIIGGGVVGCSIAYHLTQRGCRNVVVVERNAIGSGSTSRGVGGIRQQFSLPSNIRLAMYSVDFFAHFHERLGLAPSDDGVDFRQVGYLFLLSTAEELARFEQSAALQRQMGLPVEVLTPGQIANRWPWLAVSDLAGATFCPTDGYGRPYQAAKALAAGAQRQGAYIAEGTTVSAITRQGARIVSVETNRGTITPGMVVGCAGAWSGELGRMAGIDIPVRPLRRMYFATEPFDEIPHDAPLAIEVHDTFHFRPEGSGFLLAASDMQEPWSFNTEVNWAWLPTVVKDAVKRVPAFARARIHHGRAGLYETSPDHNAMLGPVPELDNFFVATGFSGHGFMQSPAAGLVLSEFILDGASHSIDVHDLGFERFSTGQLTLEKNVI